MSLLSCLIRYSLQISFQFAAVEDKIINISVDLFNMYTATKPSDLCKAIDLRFVLQGRLQICPLPIGVFDCFSFKN